MDQGKIQPDDDVRKFIPELHPHDPPVRIRDMLRCESGIWAQFHIMPLAGWVNVPMHTAYSKDDLFEVLKGQTRLPFQPGSEFQYSSGDYSLLGLVVERVTGKTLAKFAKENFFEPFGMTRTYYDEDPGLVVKNRAVGHWKSDEGWSGKDSAQDTPWRQWQPAGYVAGGGGVNSSIEDLYLWDQAFAQDRFPKGKYMREFREHGMVLGNRFCLDADAYKKRVNADPRNEPAGQYRGLKRFQFTGGFWGMTTCIARYPEQQFTVICLSNSGEVSAFGKAREIAELFLGDQMKPLPKQESKEEEFIDLDENALQSLAGAFRGKGNSPIWRTELREGKFVLVDHLDKVYELKPLSSTRFKAVGENPFYESARFDFSLDDSGRFEKVVLSSFENGFHEVIPFHRVELTDRESLRLADYVGTYVSEELGATYRFKVEGNALWLRVNSRHWEQMRLLTKDEFTPESRDPHDQRFIRFQRNGQGEVIGFSVGFWRIRNLRFSKLR